MAMYNGGCYSSFPKPPQGFPPLALTQVSPRRMDKEHIDKSVSRLATRRDKEVKLGELTPRKVLPAAELEATNNRLYAVETQKRKSAKEATEKKLAKRDPGKLMDADSLEQSVDRLYNQGQARQRELSKELKQKWNGDKGKRSKTPPQAQDLATLNERFYSSRSASRETQSQKLMEKYVYSKDLTPRKMTSDQIQQTTARLTTK
eukprot:Hpha_TRINITY_DN14986_c0_g1::TRINITY_DN14986_c0_g1_i1::g.144428::m.144428